MVTQVSGDNYPIADTGPVSRTLPVVGFGGSTLSTTTVTRSADTCDAGSMGSTPGRKPAVPDRGVLRVDDVSRATGLDLRTIVSLMRDQLSDDSVWFDQELTRPFGIFDDALPSRHLLMALGLRVRGDYDPAALRSTPWDGIGLDDGDDEVDDAPEGSCPTWRITW